MPLSNSTQSWLRPGALVLAKFEAYPHWPAIEGFEETSEGRAWKKGDRREEETYWCIFLNHYSGAWIPRINIKPYNGSTVALHHRDDVSCMTKREKTLLNGAYEEASDRRNENRALMSVSSNIHIVEGSLVLAKCDAFPVWPAVVERDNDSFTERKKKQWICDGKIHCRFLGEDKHAWLDEEHVFPYSYDLMSRTAVRSSNELVRVYAQAVREAQKIAKTKNDKENYGSKK